ncbi:MAG: tRNA 2-thiouridine(34) synthase MnmA [Candidatus Doudnabacteria bacterium]|nr:tRNA 2-thiouridine(34) synthase MnmA [Candidatus Doudnabacteria bacterium]
MKNFDPKKKTVVIGMSGGVDSSVTAALLKEQGLDCIGVYMKNWSEDFGDYGCTWAEDAEDARKVAQQLDIPFYVWNFEKEYYDKVVEYFLREYAAGRTPNPDVMCNSEIKFKVFLNKALALGADFVATGHYARIVERESWSVNMENPDVSRITYHLMKGVDPAKDQSYFLYTLKQGQLAKILFPIGGYKKQEIRNMARDLNLPNAEKKDSQGICFIGKINVTEFLREHVKARAGEIVTTTGQSLGNHTGLPFYTLGQREGIGIGGQGPYYVAGKDFDSNRLIVTNNQQDPMLWKKEFTMTDVSWVSDEPQLPFRAGVSIRYHHPDYEAKVEEAENSKQKSELKITFDDPQRAITPGQAAVIYDGDECLGGGVIERIL